MKYAKKIILCYENNSQGKFMILNSSFFNVLLKISFSYKDNLL